MAIPLENMVGYIRSRTKLDRGKPGPDGKAAEVVELYIDANIQMLNSPGGPVVTKPADCAGILYAVGDGKLEVRYPE